MNQRRRFKAKRRRRNDRVFRVLIAADRPRAEALRLVLYRKLREPETIEA